MDNMITDQVTKGMGQVDFELQSVNVGTVTTVWFTIGCWHDMRVFFRRLREERVDVHDDGTVSDEDQAEMVASDQR